MNFPDGRRPTIILREPIVRPFFIGRARNLFLRSFGYVLLRLAAERLAAFLGAKVKNIIPVMDFAARGVFFVYLFPADGISCHGLPPLRKLLSLPSRSSSLHVALDFYQVRHRRRRYRTLRIAEKNIRRATPVDTLLVRLIPAAVVNDGQPRQQPRCYISRNRRHSLIVVDAYEISVSDPSVLGVGGVHPDRVAVAIALEPRHVPKRAVNAIARVGTQHHEWKTLDVGVIHAPMDRLIGCVGSEIAPVVGEIVDQLTMSVEMEFTLLRLIGDDMAVKLDLAALRLQRLAAFDKISVPVIGLVESLIDIDPAGLL